MTAGPGWRWRFRDEIGHFGGGGGEAVAVDCRWQLTKHKAEPCITALREASEVK